MPSPITMPVCKEQSIAICTHLRGLREAANGRDADEGGANGPRVRSPPGPLRWQISNAGTLLSNLLTCVLEIDCLMGIRETGSHGCWAAVRVCRCRATSTVDIGWLCDFERLASTRAPVMPTSGDDFSCGRKPPKFAHSMDEAPLFDMALLLLAGSLN